MPRPRTPPPIEAVFATLQDHFGPQHWWPGRTRAEVIIGAILTQNTAWTNVEKAIRNLRRARALNFAALRNAGVQELAAWIRPAGYFNVKAARLKSFAEFMYQRFDGNLHRLLSLPVAELRTALLSVNGIGPETADCIILYAAEKPVFVVDAYTRRLVERHGWLPGAATYDEIAALFTANLPMDVAVFNEFHALIVALGKQRCRPEPRCDGCPLGAFAVTAQAGFP